MRRRALEKEQKEAGMTRLRSMIGGCAKDGTLS